MVLVLYRRKQVFPQAECGRKYYCILEMTKLSKKEQKENWKKLLDEFRLQHVRKNNGDTLSRWQREAYRIARALAVDPNLFYWMSLPVLTLLRRRYTGHCCQLKYQI